MTDLAGNPLDSGSAILDDTTIDVVAKPIGVTGGDFEDPYTNGQPGDVPFWFDSDYGYADWHNAAQYSANGSQTALINRYGNNGYIYQSLGQLAAGTQRLVWSLDQVKGNGTADLRFFHGISADVGQGVDIDTLGLTQIGSTVSFPGTSDNVVSRTGSVDVSAVPAGATIWMDFTNTSWANDWAVLLDNISVNGAASGQEIAVEQPAGTNIPSGSGSRDFGTVALGYNTSLPFTVRNPGTADLYLTGTAPHYVVITGADAADFTVTAQPSTPVVSGGGTTTFTVRFAPGGTGARSAALSIANDDTTDDEDPFIINLSGTGSTVISGYDAWSGGAAFGDDTNGDGVANGLAFLLGAADKDANALGRLPAPANDSGKLVMAFDCLAAAARGSAALTVQFSNDLGAADPWTGNEVAVPGAVGSFPDTGSGVSFEVTANGGLLHVVATVAASKATAAGRLFGRLAATQ
jgi:hypothetical protein